MEPTMFSLDFAEVISQASTVFAYFVPILIGVLGLALGPKILKMVKTMVKRA